MKKWNLSLLLICLIALLIGTNVDEIKNILGVQNSSGQIWMSQTQSAEIITSTREAHFLNLEDLLSSYESMVNTVAPALNIYNFYARMGKTGEKYQPSELFDDDDLMNGYEMTFNVVVDFSPAETYEEIKAKIAYIDDKYSFWLQNGISTDEEFIQSTLTQIEEYLEEVITPVFPIKGEEKKIHIVVVNMNQDFILGYYDHSFTIGKYINPDDFIIFLNADLLTVGEEIFISVALHEITHLIATQYDANEDIWLSESLAEYAPLLIDMENKGFKDVYLLDTTQQITFINQLHETYSSISSYGGGAYYLASLGYRCGDEFITGVTLNDENGTDSINQELIDLCQFPANIGVDPLANMNQAFLDFGISLQLNSQSKRWRNYFTEDEHEKYGLTQFTQSCDEGIKQYTSAQYGIQFIETTCDSPFEIQFSGNTTIDKFPSASQKEQFLSIKNAANGDYQLTSQVDLTQVEEAELIFNTYFKLGHGQNSFYVEVSDDLDEWVIVSYPSGAIRQAENNLLAKYDGFTEDWTEIHIDLSDFVGKKIYLRFEVLNYGDIYEPIVLIDDIAIPEIGYYEGFETDFSEWDLDGFYLANPYYPQFFQVAWIPASKKEEDVFIFDVNFLEENKTSVILPGNGVLIVIPTTSQLTETADFQLVLSRE